MTRGARSGLPVTASPPAAATSHPASRSSRRSAANGDDLLQEVASTAIGDPHRPALRERAIEAWLPLANNLAKRYAGRGEHIDDLIQTAAVGLVKAIDHFDDNRGVDFTAYAIPTILGELKRHFRDRAWAVRVPRRLQELRLAISAANSTLTHALGRSPKVADIATYLGVTEEAVLEGIEGARAYRTTSLSTPLGTDSTTELGDTLGTTEHDYELVELHVALTPAMAALPDRERKILTMRFYGNMTQAQIAEQVGVSQMHVSRLIATALARLHGYLTDDVR
ncbi:SigB/SigF/SigG family RNA polymerase sigma factor [Micromonospora sp. CPCC 205539]|uniref:SigB/SigF/SigG family RNA polymerase sigma factor n=1 Tax=Micromonospora sp. CPCC 205539 TaxID=3122408 RepID=UPI002FEF3CA5